MACTNGRCRSAPIAQAGVAPANTHPAVSHETTSSPAEIASFSMRFLRKPSVPRSLRLEKAYRNWTGLSHN